jgi:hypothetical protein
MAGRSRLRRAHAGWASARFGRLSSRRSHPRDRRQRRAPAGAGVVADRRDWDLPVWRGCSVATTRQAPGPARSSPRITRPRVPCRRCAASAGIATGEPASTVSLPNPRGIFSGTYDAAVPSHIRWAAAPELDLSGVAAAGLSGRNSYLRVRSFAECNGRLHPTVGQQIYRSPGLSLGRAKLVEKIEPVGVTESLLDEGEVFRDFRKQRVGWRRVSARFVVAAALIDHRPMVCHWPGALSKCQRKIEMSPGAQSRDDTLVGGGYAQRDTASQPDAGSGLSYHGR